jgi:hypothetical protein
LLAQLQKSLAGGEKKRRATHGVFACVRACGPLEPKFYGVLIVSICARAPGKKINESRARGRQMLLSEANLANGIALPAESDEFRF